MPDTSYKEMINVKKQFFKTDGIQCFHAVQSFVKGEIKPRASTWDWYETCWRTMGR